MFQFGIQRMDVFSNPSFGRPHLGQYDDSVHTMPSSGPGSDIFSDITKATAIILAPTQKPLTPVVRPAVAPAASSDTAVLVGAGVLGAVIAGVLFLT
jgi:hypothetical protein